MRGVSHITTVCTLLRFCSMSKMFFCTLSAFFCSFAIRFVRSEDSGLEDKQTCVSRDSVRYAHKLSLFPTLNLPLRLKSVFSSCSSNWNVGALLCRINTESLCSLKNMILRGGACMSMICDITNSLEANPICSKHNCDPVHRHWGRTSQGRRHLVSSRKTCKNEKYL